MSWRLIGAYLFLVALTVGFGLGIAFIIKDVGFAPGLVGVLGVPLGLGTGHVLFSPRFRDRRIPRRIPGLGVGALVLGVAVAGAGGNFGGLFLLGFAFGFCLHVLWTATRLRQRVD